MKSLACKKMGMESCSFVAHGETNEEVKKIMMDHVKMAHPDMLKDMDSEKKMEMEKKMDEMIE